MIGSPGCHVSPSTITSNNGVFLDLTSSEWLSFGDIKWVDWGSKSVQQSSSEVGEWRVKYVGQRKFGSSAAENTSAWIVGICHRDTMDAADLLGHH
jgi:hypothetical protein